MELQKWKILQHLDPTFAADVKRVHLIGISSYIHHEIPDGGESDDEEDTEKVSTLPTMDELEKSRRSGAVVIMKNDDVYLITRNYKEVLSFVIHGRKDLLPFVPIKIGELCGQQIRAITSGPEHVAVLTVQGRIYQWGCIYVDDKEIIRFDPQFLAGDGIENKLVIQIACGECHTVALTSEGDVYTWGSNRYGQLGTGRAVKEIRPTKISGLYGFDGKISMVACCGWTSFALEQDGTVWSWGDSGDDALGYESSEPQIIPLKIVDLENIKMIAAGNTHALALSNDRELYFWGQHATEGTTVAPEKIGIPNISFIGAIRGSTISAFQTAKRKVYIWGFAYGHDIHDPVLTKFSTIAEVFASLDSPPDKHQSLL